MPSPPPPFGETRLERFVIEQMGLRADVVQSVLEADIASGQEEFRENQADRRVVAPSLTEDRSRH